MQKLSTEQWSVASYFFLHHILFCFCNTSFFRSEEHQEEREVIEEQHLRMLTRDYASFISTIHSLSYLHLSYL